MYVSHIDASESLLCRRHNVLQLPRLETLRTGMNDGTSFPSIRKVLYHQPDGILGHAGNVVGVSLLEQDNHVRRLLGSETEGTSVRLGSETDVAEADFAVVSTTFDAGLRGLGRVGVLGPMRMDYRRTIRIVEEVGDGLEDSLGA